MADLSDLFDPEMGFFEDSEPEKRVGAGIDYEDPKEVADLMAKHLGKIFIATHRRKIEKEMCKLKEERRPRQLDLFQRKEPCLAWA